jgi:hypothetical protein
MMDPDREPRCAYCDDRGCSECLRDWAEEDRLYMEAYWEANDQAEEERRYWEADS